MKQNLLTILLIGLVTGVFAQGAINVANLNFGNNSPTATTGGLFWLDTTGCGPSLINQDFNLNFYGGSDANSLTLLKSFVNTGGGAIAGPGTFLDLSGIPVSVPGALTSGYFRIEAWIGSPTFFNSIFRASSPVFTNPLGNPLAAPPATPTDLTGMPAMVLQSLAICPEPSTFVLAGLGAAALLMFRHRT